MDARILAHFQGCNSEHLLKALRVKDVENALELHLRVMWISPSAGLCFVITMYGVVLLLVTFYFPV